MKALAEILPAVVEQIARRAVAYHLTRASKLTGQEAARAFTEADAIRQSLDLAWIELVTRRQAA